MYIFYLSALVVAGSLVQILAFGAPVASTVLAWLLGAQLGLGGIWAFLGHYFKSDEIAAYIGWPKGNLFQKEIAFTNLAIGLAGVLSFILQGTSLRNGFWLATLVMALVFLGGAFTVHVGDFRKRGNTNPGNMGPVFYADILVPVLGFVLYIAM